MFVTGSSRKYYLPRQLRLRDPARVEQRRRHDYDHDTDPDPDHDHDHDHDTDDCDRDTRRPIPRQHHHRRNQRIPKFQPGAHHTDTTSRAKTKDKDLFATTTPSGTSVIFQEASGYRDFGGKACAASTANLPHPSA
ncbi:hypothetical protein KC323_g9413 [Hortaea werneckii]|nr:hypothetical protein KC323_g9413 [Hortaea werneckii]